MNKNLQILKTAIAITAISGCFLIKFTDKKIYAIALLIGIAVEIILLFQRFASGDIITDPKEVNKNNLHDLAFSLACYYVASTLFPKLDDQLSLFFWFTIFAEIGLNFWFIKKFKRPNLEGVGLKVFNTIVNLAFVLLLVNLSYQLLFGVALLAGIIVYTDFALIIYFLPYYHEKINFSWQARKVKQEYEKYLKR